MADGGRCMHRPYRRPDLIGKRRGETWSNRGYADPVSYVLNPQTPFTKDFNEQVK